MLVSAAAWCKAMGRERLSRLSAVVPAAWWHVAGSLEEQYDTTSNRSSACRDVA